MSAGQQAVPANNANNASNEGAQKKHMSKAAVAIIAVVVVAIIVVAGVFGFRAYSDAQYRAIGTKRGVYVRGLSLRE